MSTSDRLFEFPPILPWFRADSKKPLKAQLSKARVLKGIAIRSGGARGPMRFPELRVVKPPPGAREGRKPR